MSAVTVSAVTNQPLAQEFEQIFLEHYEFVYRTAYSVTGSAEDAEDIVQTLFLRLLRREDQPDLKRNAKAYLYRAAFNLSLNLVRARRRVVLTAEPDRFEIPANSAVSDSDDDIENRLHAAIAELKPMAAQILVLRYVHNYSDAEIAKLLGTTRG